jgi:cytochrome c-type biogenesis protein CcmF
MHWAYAVLGWSGYWGWDSADNASLMPWLTGTAFLHSLMLQEKKGMMKSWNVWLIFSTFLLTMPGTLLMRPDLVSSVHTFAQSSIKTWLLAFMAIVVAVCVTAYARNRDYLKSEHQFTSALSRESGVLFNNLVLLAFCVVILWGALFPILSGSINDNKVMTGAPFYNQVAVPIGLFLLLLTGVGPLLPWRGESFKSIQRDFELPLVALWLTAIACLVVGVRPWRDGSFNWGNFYALVAFAVSAGVLTAILTAYLRGARDISKQTDHNLLTAFWLLTRSNARRYGGYIIHIGVVIVVVGLAGSTCNISEERELKPGDRLAIGPYILKEVGATLEANQNYNSDHALLDVYRHGVRRLQMAPEKRLYQVNGQPQTMVAIHSVAAWDLYVVYKGINPNTGQPIIKAFLYPLVDWIWGGAAVMVLGAIVALAPNSIEYARRSREGMGHDRIADYDS